MVAKDQVRRTLNISSSDDMVSAMHTLFSATVNELKEKGGGASGADRFFFPQGIQKIHVVLSIGQKEAPIASIEIEVSGQKSDITTTE